MLTEAVGDGRLTPEEHEQRLAEATSARTLGDLAGLTSDLVGPDAQPVRLDGSRPLFAVFGTQRREGRWVVPDRLSVTAVLGEAVLDFRDALLHSPRTVLYATVIGGRLRLLVPDGVDVQVTTSGVANSQRRTASRRTSATRPGQPGPGQLGPEQEPPVIEVRGLMIWGRVQVITPPKGRFLGIFPRRGR
jgi:hypothetical protein